MSALLPSDQSNLGDTSESNYWDDDPPSRWCTAAGINTNNLHWWRDHETRASVDQDHRPHEQVELLDSEDACREYTEGVKPWQLCWFRSDCDEELGRKLDSDNIVELPSTTARSEDSPKYLNVAALVTTPRAQALDELYAPVTFQIAEEKDDDSFDGNFDAEPKLGDVVLLNQMAALVRYVGEVPEKDAGGIWYGVELKGAQLPHGNDGSIRGQQYFKCKKGQGTFVQSVTRVISPEELLRTVAILNECLKQCQCQLQSLKGDVA